MAEVPVLALDGPGGSGKGSVASRIANLRHWRILDSGALYRAFAFSAQQLGVLPNDSPGIQRVLAETNFDFVGKFPLSDDHQWTSLKYYTPPHCFRSGSTKGGGVIFQL